MCLFFDRAASSARPRHGLPVFAAGLLLLSASAVKTSASSVSDARDLFKEYIEMRKLIGEESSAWENQKITLVDMVAVLKTERDQLQASIETLRGSATSADQKRADLNTAIEKGKATSTAFDSTIATLEESLRTMAPRLPAPLVTELQPLLTRLPTDSTTRLGYSQRLQTIIGVLAQADKFNSDLRYVSAVQVVDGQSIEVQTLYFGLAAALFTDASGTYAGHGFPAADGWKWTRASAADAPQIAEAVDVYLSRRAPAFVPVPLQLD